MKATNCRKSSIRANVEQVFGVIKRTFGLQKVCYRSPGAEPAPTLEATAGLANLCLFLELPVTRTID